MKKLIIFFFLNCIIHSSYSQQVLNKIFELRLGMTEKELYAVVDTSYLIADKNLELLSVFERLEGRVTSYYLKQYTPMPGYTINKISLIFFDGKLYRIRIKGYNFRIESLLTQKYGEPETETEQLEAERLPSSQREMHIVTKKWKTNNKNIVCLARYSVIDGNEKLTDNTVSLTDIEAGKAMLDEYMRREDERLSRENKKLLDKL